MVLDGKVLYIYKTRTVRPRVFSSMHSCFYLSVFLPFFFVKKLPHEGCFYISTVHDVRYWMILFDSRLLDL